MSDYIPGYGALGARLKETPRARLYQYHRWTLWIPNSLVKMHEGVEYAPTFALDTAKKQAEAFAAGRGPEA